MGEKLEFPKGFVWGTATAGHQIEGHNKDSNWWSWELEPGHVSDGTASGACVDYWNRFEADHKLMNELGYPAFRLGIEWAKIEPEKGRYSQDALDHYRQILQSLKDHDISICLTLNHWVIPKWFEDQGSWENPRAVDWFMDYATLIAQEFAGYPDLWVTLNEPLVPVTAGYMVAEHPPSRKDFFAAAKVFRVLLRCHAKAYDMLHKVIPLKTGIEPMVGVATAYQRIEPWGSPGVRGVIENALARVARQISFDAWDTATGTGRIPPPFGVNDEVPGLRDSVDYVGVNYYFRSSLKIDPSKKDSLYVDYEAAPEGIKVSEMNNQIYPRGFYQVLTDVWHRFGKPIYITENGTADEKDAFRPQYLLEHIAAMHLALSQGADIRGYFQWSFTDNFEWAYGFSKRFGLVQVDHDDPRLERRPRRSAYMYSKIIKENGITEDIVNEFAPEAWDGVFGDRWK